MPANQTGTSAESSSADDATTSLDVAKAALGDNPEGSEQENELESSPGSDENKDPAEGKKPEWDPLSVVKKAVEETRKVERPEDKPEDGAGEQDPGESSKPDDGQKKKPDAEELGEITEEELKSYKPKTRKRIEGLLEDRQRLTDENTDLKPQAEQFQQLTSYMRDNHLGSEEVAELMVVGAMAKSKDPADLQTAIQKTRDFLSQLELAAGEKLPEDLQKKVDDGLLDAESAKETSLSRVKAKRAESEVETANKVVEATNVRTQAQEVSTAIADWQRGKVTSDPDYQSKQAFLQTEIALRVAKEKGGRVLDKNRALQIAEEAYAAVSDKVKAVLPKAHPQPKKVVTSRSAPGNMASKPSTPIEAAREALKATRGG
jgi:hypothetical protein